MHRKLETSWCFAAALAVIAVEAILMWWLWHAIRLAPTPYTFYFGDWLSPLVPGLSVAGVMAAMIHRLGLVLKERERADEHWRLFRRLAYSFVALASAGGSALYLSFGRFLR